MARSTCRRHQSRRRVPLACSTRSMMRCNWKAHHRPHGKQRRLSMTLRPAGPQRLLRARRAATLGCGISSRLALWRHWWRPHLPQQAQTQEGVLRRVTLPPSRRPARRSTTDASALLSRMPARAASRTAGAHPGRPSRPRRSRMRERVLPVVGTQLLLEPLSCWEPRLTKFRLLRPRCSLRQLRWLQHAAPCFLLAVALAAPVLVFQQQQPPGCRLEATLGPSLTLCAPPPRTRARPPSPRG
jgi:hypothetical protein